MGKTNFQYDETGNTYYYVFLTFLGLILLPSTYYMWPSFTPDDPIDPEKRKKYISAAAKGTVYWEACSEKAERMSKKDPWVKTRRRLAYLFLLVGWVLFAIAVYQASQFDYEMANFDPYEILEVTYDASAKEIKKKYREMSLKYHPDKPTGNEKLFMKLTKAYNALTDETARYNWEHYGNPDGPQAMQFGIGLPAWIVDEKNSILVLGVYTLIFMIGLPTAVYYWWSNSLKFSGEQVLLDTTQLYYYFFHKTPHMMLRRVLMVLAASMEFERGHNPEVVERPTDNVEIPQLMKAIPMLGINNKEKPLCYGYSVKTRALLFAHLSRIALPHTTLHIDRLFVIKKCPYLIHEMVQCVSQLILLAHAGRIGRLPSLDTIEYAMKCSPMVVQAMWEKSSPLLQLPHIVDDMMKHFSTRKRNIKTLQQLAKMKDEDRRSLLRTLTDEQYRDVIRVLSLMPLLSVKVTTEVIDDEEQHVVTAGAIVTVTVSLTRNIMESLMTGVDLNSLDANEGDEIAGNNEDKEMDVIDTDEVNELKLEEQEKQAAAEDEEDAKKKNPVWRKPDKKKKVAKKPPTGGKKQQKAKKGQAKAAAAAAANAEGGAAGDSQTQANATNKASDTTTSDTISNSKHNKKSRRRKTNEDGNSDSDNNESDSNSNDSDDNEEGGERTKNNGGSAQPLEEEDDEEEWQRFQKRMNKREKALEGKSRISHSVHCPFFTDDKQEHWWVYIADRKNHALLTPPNHVTALVNHEEVELIFTAPPKPGHYSFTVCVRSDSYLGVDVQEDIKLEVCEAKEAPTEHPQWEFEDDEEESESKDEDSDEEYATDDDYDEDDE